MIFNKLIKKYYQLEKQKSDSSTSVIPQNELFEIAKADAFEEYSKQKPFAYTEEQRNIYKTIGGTPHLDGSYTVFAEITKGLDVLEAISKVETDSHDRPVQDVIIKKIKVIHK